MWADKYLIMAVHKHNTTYYLFNDTADFIHNKSCLQHKFSQTVMVVILNIIHDIKTSKEK